MHGRPMMTESNYYDRSYLRICEAYVLLISLLSSTTEKHKRQLLYMYLVAQFAQEWLWMQPVYTKTVQNFKSYFGGTSFKYKLKKWIDAMPSSLQDANSHSIWYLYLVTETSQWPTYKHHFYKIVKIVCTCGWYYVQHYLPAQRTSYCSSNSSPEV